MLSGGTPLFFKGSEGAILKPFVPSVTRANQSASENLSKTLNTNLSDSHIQDESKMRKVDLSNKTDSQDFAFMK